MKSCIFDSWKLLTPSGHHPTQESLHPDFCPLEQFCLSLDFTQNTPFCLASFSQRYLSNLSIHVALGSGIFISE